MIVGKANTTRSQSVKRWGSHNVVFGAPKETRAMLV
jgi:hypothetical protein